MQPIESHLETMWTGIQADMREDATPHRSVKDLNIVEQHAQRRWFGRVMWGPDITNLSWKQLPYHVAQVLLYGEASYLAGFFDDPENPLTDPFKPARDKRQEDDLLKDGQPSLRIWTRFVLGDRAFADLPTLPPTERHGVLERALLLTTQGNALDPHIQASKLKVQAVASQPTRGNIIVDDLDALVEDLVSPDVEEAVIFQDNVGAELIGLTIFTAVFLRMFPHKRVTWSNKEAAFAISDVVRRDVVGWETQIPGVDGRGWLERFSDLRYTGGDRDVQALLEFVNQARVLGDRRGGRRGDAAPAGRGLSGRERRPRDAPQRAARARAADAGDRRSRDRHVRRRGGFRRDR